MKKPESLKDHEISEALDDIISIINTAASAGKIEVIHVILVRPDGTRLRVSFPKEKGD